MQPPPRVPVIMYHSVGRILPGWIWSDLTTKMEFFEKQVKLLKKNGFQSISLDDFRNRQESGTAGKKREVVLTFDDGYLDNWVCAYPILKREGWRGTIYVNPDFIDPGEEPRPTLEDVWSGKCSLDDLTLHGFLNRAELRQLQESGVMVIASHSMTHTWYPTGPEIVDNHRPDLSTPWLAWNARPERKFAYLTEDQSDFVPFGSPIHAHGRSLGIRRYFPGEPEGRYETDEEMKDRFRAEIFDSREILEDIIGAPVTHFCFPGGAYCQDSWAVAEEAGYTTTCVTRKDHLRWSDGDPRLVRRIGCSDSVTFLGKRYPTDDPAFLLLACEIELGTNWKKWPLRLRKLATGARSGF